MRVLVLSLMVSLVGCSSEPPPPMPVDDALVASGLRITQVAAYQVLKTTLMKDGQPGKAEVPVIEGRPTMLRVFVTPDQGWDGREVLVRVNLTAGGQDQPALETRRAFTKASVEGDLTTTVNFDLTAEQTVADLTWSVSLHEVTPALPPETGGARYPADGTAVSFGTRSTGGGEQVVVIPVAYDADGSGRLPDTSAASLEPLRQRMLALYPVNDVKLTVGKPLHWTAAVKSNGSGWGQLLNAVINQRIKDGVPSNVYYYGLMVPAASFGTFCQQGCVLGLSPASSDPDDEYQRGSLGLGYPGKSAESDITFVHEVGHAHGRLHAPCQVGDPDPDYPYADGEIGDWGINLTAKTLIDPAGNMRDMMGYCSPVWISDYTYKALYDRVAYLNMVPQRLTTATRWRSVVIEGDQATRGELVSVHSVKGSEARTVERVTAAGVEKIPSKFYPFDHLPGGILLIPEDADLGSLRFEGRSIK